MELNLLKHDEYKRMYAVEVQNQYEALSKEESDQGSDLEVVGLDREWQLLKSSMVQATKNVLPKKDRVKRKSWMTTEILQKMQERKKHKGTEKYKEIGKEIRHMYKNGRKHGGMKSVKKSKNWNGNTKQMRCMPR